MSSDIDFHTEINIIFSIHHIGGGVLYENKNIHFTSYLI